MTTDERRHSVTDKERAPRYMPFCRLREPHDEIEHHPKHTDCLCPCHGTAFAWWTPKGAAPDA